MKADPGSHEVECPMIPSSCEEMSWNLPFLGSWVDQS